MTSDGIVNPVPLAMPDPRYSSAALNARLQGTVTFTAVVGVDGALHTPHILDSFDPVFGLDDAAMSTAAQWRFRPGSLNGQLVPVIVTLKMEFHIAGSSGTSTPWRTQGMGSVAAGSAGRRSESGAPPAAALPVVAPPVHERPSPVVWLSAAPHYPLEALRRDWQGSVALSVTVLQDGRVGDVQVTNSPSGAPVGVADEAVACVKQWIFAPALVDGQPVSKVRPVTVNFQFH